MRFCLWTLSLWTHPQIVPDTSLTSFSFKVFWEENSKLNEMIILKCSTYTQFEFQWLLNVFCCQALISNIKNIKHQTLKMGEMFSHGLLLSEEAYSSFIISWADSVDELQTHEVCFVSTGWEEKRTMPPYVHKVALLHVTGQVTLDAGSPSRRSDASHEPAHLKCNRATTMYTERFLILLVGL